MEYDQRCIGLFLELERHREKLLDNSTATQAYTQRAITTFFSPMAPTNATSQSKATQMGSQVGHSEGVTLNRT